MRGARRSDRNTHIGATSCTAKHSQFTRTVRIQNSGTVHHAKVRHRPGRPGDGNAAACGQVCDDMVQVSRESIFGLTTA